MKNNKRAETGAMQFGGDWPGVFIRGDNAAYYGMLLKQFLENPEEIKNNGIMAATLHGLLHTLNGCVVAGEDPPGVQYMKAFGEAESNGKPERQVIQVDVSDVPPEHVEWFVEGVRRATTPKKD